jgi:GT2 family glycosyltransferase
LIYIIVPTFGRVENTEKFLDSLSNSVDKEYLVLIVDDHPGQVTLKNIHETERIKIYTSKNELWWVGSINFGIEILFNNYNIKENDIVVFSNNDVQIDKISFITLYNEIQYNGNQIVHPRTIDQDHNEVSSGAQVISYFPYITVHPKNFKEERRVVNMGTARFLMMNVKTLKTVGYINKGLLQYLGDNDFTLKAKRKHNINTYILRDAVCRLDDTQTGLKNNNIKNIKELWISFSSIKSPNNIKYRYILFKSHFNSLCSFFITLSMTFNSILKFILGKVK